MVFALEDSFDLFAMPSMKQCVSIEEQRRAREKARPSELGLTTKGELMHGEFDAVLFGQFQQSLMRVRVA